MHALRLALLSLLVVVLAAPSLTFGALILIDDFNVDGTGVDVSTDLGTATRDIDVGSASILAVGGSVLVIADSFGAEITDPPLRTLIGTLTYTFENPSNANFGLISGFDFNGTVFAARAGTPKPFIEWGWKAWKEGATDPFASDDTFGAAGDHAGARDWGDLDSMVMESSATLDGVETLEFTFQSALYGADLVSAAGKDLTAVPEPSCLLLSGLGAMGMALMGLRRVRRRK